jgi:hypothetical protein
MLRISHFPKRQLDGSYAWKPVEDPWDFDQTLRTKTRVRRLEELFHFDPDRQHRNRSRR